MSESLIDSRFKRSTILNVIIKGVSVLLGLVTVNIYIRFLGSGNYGLWVTVSSIASWAAMGNLGIGNGLRNKLAGAYAENDKKKQAELIETGLSALTRLSFIILVVITIVSEVLINTCILGSEVRVALYITNVFMCINFVLSTFKSAAFAYQYSHLASGSQILYVVINIMVVMLLIAGGVSSNLPIFALINGLSNVVANMVLYFVFRAKTHIRIRFSLKPNPEHMKSIISIGIRFFILQLCGLILYSTDNVIINKLFGSNEVTKYEVITRVFSAGENSFAILLTSLWSAVTFQFSLGEYKWIRKKTHSLLKLWILFSVGVIIVAVGFNYIVKAWLQENAIIYESQIIVVFAFYTIACTFGSIYVNVANGMNMIKLQMYMSVIEAVINIPLSVILATTFGFGIMGVKLATLICCTGANVVMPIYVERFLIEKTKVGNPNGVE